MADEIDEVGVRLVIDGQTVFSSKMKAAAESIKEIDRAAAAAQRSVKLSATELDHSTRSIDDFGRNIRGAFRDVGASFTNFGSGIGTVTSGVQRLASLQFLNYNAWGVLATGITGAATAASYFGLKTYSGLEQANIAFTQFLGSADKSSAFMEQLKEFAATTPFDFANLVPSAQRLLNTGDDPAKALQDLRAIGDAAAGADPMEGQAGVDRIALALSQIKMAPKLSGQELMQLRNANINPYRYLAEAKGVSETQIYADQQKGLIPGAPAAEVILAGMEKQYGGLMAKENKTLAGQLSNLHDTISFQLADATKPLAELLERNMPVITKDLSKLATLFGHTLGTVIKDGQQLWAAFQLNGMDGVMATLGDMTGTGTTFLTLWRHIKTDSVEIADVWQHSLYPAIQDVERVLGPLAFGALGAVEGILKWMNDHPDAARVIFEGLAAAFTVYKITSLVVGLTTAFGELLFKLPMVQAAMLETGTVSAVAAGEAEAAWLSADAAMAAGPGGAAAKTAAAAGGASVLSQVGGAAKTAVKYSAVGWLGYEGGKLLNNFMEDPSKKDERSFVARLNSGMASEDDLRRYATGKGYYDDNYNVKIPGQAAGGVTTSPGWTMVGEKGPELRYSPMGATVIPLDQAGGSSNAGLRTVVFEKGSIHIEAADYLNGQALADTVIESIKDQLARN